VKAYNCTFRRKIKDADRPLLSRSSKSFSLFYACSCVYSGTRGVHVCSGDVTRWRYRASRLHVCLQALIFAQWVDKATKQ